MKNDTVTEFESFWKAYPRRVAKGAARRAWSKAVVAATPERIMEALLEQRGAGVFKDSTFIPYPATWLNQERWEDEIGAGGTDPRVSGLATSYRAACAAGDDMAKMAVRRDAKAQGVVWEEIHKEIARQGEEERIK